VRVPTNTLNRQRDTSESHISKSPRHSTLLLSL